MAGPTLVVIAGIVTAWIAVKHVDPVLSDDYYKQGLAINRLIDKAQAAAKMGIQAEVMRSGTNLRAFLHSNDVSYGLPETLNLKLQHPTLSGHDQLVTLQHEAKGYYVGELLKPAIGRWNVMMEDAEKKWRLTGTWQMDNAGEGNLKMRAKMQ